MLKIGKDPRRRNVRRAARACGGGVTGDIVDDFYAPFVRPLGNLVIAFAWAEAELLDLVLEMLGGDELKAVALLKSQNAKEQVLISRSIYRTQRVALKRDSRKLAARALAGRLADRIISAISVRGVPSVCDPRALDPHRDGEGRETQPGASAGARR
jgi:hypothetical protein